jgi:hypothetical protein
MARYTAADGLSNELINLDRNFGDVLVRARILKEAPLQKPKLPNEVIFTAEGQRIEAEVPDEVRFALLAFLKDGRPYLQAKTSKETWSFSGVEPANDPNEIAWPADLVASYKREWQAWLERKNKD